MTKRSEGALEETAASRASPPAASTSSAAKKFASDCTDCQARRLDCRNRADRGPRFVYTLNGTGIAVGRTLIAIMENCLRAGCSVAVPEVPRHRAGRPAKMPRALR